MNQVIKDKMKHGLSFRQALEEIIKEKREYEKNLERYKIMSRYK